MYIFLFIALDVWKGKRTLQHWSRMICPMRLLKVLRVENPAKQSWWIGKIQLSDHGELRQSTSAGLIHGAYVYTSCSWEEPGRYLSKNAKGAILWCSNDFEHVGRKANAIYYPQVLEQLGRQVLHHIQLKNSCEKFHFFVRIEIAIKMDDRMLNFRHFDFYLPKLY
jgi:hypothetical protein